ncbi:DUF4105 domain-containing protein [Halobacteriovorax sp. CON-3]|uniref:lipoprotein N-acyltransferase Lnb domain-containing protein n=1 Tax=Halobacteriovorax sp. CON-3 TaxID=3157710 RepID=UPI0037212753
MSQFKLTACNIQQSISKLIKAPLLGALFFIIQNVNAQSIAQDPHWVNLLYLTNGKQVIEDKMFYLSSHSPTPESELHLLQKELDSNLEVIKCRFPARAYWLSKKLNREALSFSSCKGLNEFLTKAPLEEISLVFASENVSNPSSMMGHTYLEFGGNDKRHALTFYTELEGINLPKVMFESIVTGKEGFYALSPASHLEKGYLKEEGRNIWKYHLNLTNEQKKLLHLHLYELRRIKLDYYFHTFNCATLMNYIIATVWPSINDHKANWMTPLDLVRATHKSGLINDTKAILADKWLVKAIYENLEIDPLSINEIKQKGIASIEELPQLELAQAYNRYQYFEESKNYKEFSLLSDKIDKTLEQSFPNGTLDFSQYKNPANAPSNSQVYLSHQYFRNDKEEQRSILGLLPASHLLSDDNRMYINESELRVANVELSYSKSKLRLNKLLLIGAKIFQISDPLTGGISGGFQIGYTDYINRHLKFENDFKIGADIGKTFRLHRDIDFYLIQHNSLYTSTDFYIAGLSTGIILRSYESLKFHLRYSLSFYVPNQYEYLEEAVLDTSYRINKNLGFIFSLNASENSTRSIQSIKLDLNYYL